MRWFGTRGDAANGAAIPPAVVMQGPVSAATVSAATASAATASPATIPTASAAEPPGAPVLALLRHWLSLSAVERRTFQALCEEIAGTSDMIETGITGLSERFGALAGLVRDQSALVEQVVTVAGTIEADGQKVTLGDVTAHADKAVSQVIDTIESKSTEMIAALQQAAVQVAETDRAVVEIERINAKANLLALNATIEAHRAGEAGKTFVVVANEVRDLSKSTNQTAGTIRQQINAVAAGIVGARRTLEAIVESDLSRHQAARSRLDGMMRGLTAQSERMAGALASVQACSETIRRTVGDLVTGIQFQDRAKQNLEQVTGALGVLERALSALEQETASLPAAADALRDGAAEDERWVREIIERCTLGDVRRRFVSRVALGETASLAPTEDEGGSIELF